MEYKVALRDRRQKGNLVYNILESAGVLLPVPEVKSFLFLFAARLVLDALAPVLYVCKN
jgi:hypothetical protein